MTRIGLSGGIASGKSAVATALTTSAALREAIGGVTEHVDADAVLRTARGEVADLRAAIIEAVPEAGRPDGTIDATLLAARAFADPATLSRLEELQWPVVRTLIDEASRAADARGVRLLIVEAIALGRSGLGASLDGVIHLTVDEETRRARFLARGGVSADFDRRAAAQAGLQEELARLGAIEIDGHGTLSEVVESAIPVLRHLCLEDESTGKNHP